MQKKDELRQLVLARVKALPETARAAGSEQAISLLRAQPVWAAARRVLLFAPLPYEVNVWPLMLEALQLGKTVALPRFDARTQAYAAFAVSDCQRDICTGKFQIREPVAACPEMPLNRLDLILVPGIAFDLQGRRVGRGKGYYDRLLAAASGIACGVAFDEQIVEAIPVEPHDRHVDCILTPTRWLQR